MTIRAYVYKDKVGNRFLVPGHWYSDDNPEVGLGSQMVCTTEGFMFCAVLDMAHDGWLEIDDSGNLMHYPYRLLGGQFAHGKVDILLIEGPAMDARSNEDRGD